MKYRIEKDSLGEVKIAEDALWGPQTQRLWRIFQSVRIECRQRC